MPTNSPTPDLPALLARGPSQPLARQAVANYILTHQERIRAIARRKLTTTTRRVFDSEEVLSSVMRRLDSMAARGTLLPHSEAELWALVEAITKNTAVSKTRLIERTRNLLTEDGLYAYELLRRLNACETDDEATLLVQRMLLSLKEGADRRLVVLRLQGANHRAAADLLRTTEAATRQRWTKVRKELLERFQSEGPMDHING